MFACVLYLNFMIIICICGDLLPPFLFSQVTTGLTAQLLQKAWRLLRLLLMCLPQQPRRKEHLSMTRNERLLLLLLLLLRPLLSPERQRTDRLSMTRSAP